MVEKFIYACYGDTRQAFWDRENEIIDSFSSMTREEFCTALDKDYEAIQNEAETNFNFEALYNYGADIETMKHFVNTHTCKQSNSKLSPEDMLMILQEMMLAIPINADKYPVSKIRISQIRERYYVYIIRHYRINTCREVNFKEFIRFIRKFVRNNKSL